MPNENMRKGPRFVVLMACALLGIAIPTLVAAFRGGGERYGTGSVTPSAKPPADSGGPAVPRPKVVVAASEHDFGDLDPAEKCAHVFAIRNEGDAPLQLTRGPTTCKCTMSELPRAPIPPGGQAEVRVASKLQQTQGAFSHSATVLTNDPQHKSLVLKIMGTVRTHLGASPPRIAFETVKRNRPQSREVVVFSQVWEEFTIADVQCSLGGVAWDIEPVGRDLLAPLRARCGYKLKVALPPEMAEGVLWEKLQLTAVPAGDSAQRRTLIIELTGDVEGLVAYYGAKIDP